ncbi:MAG TPA: hypothetical protein VHM30_17565, partial [Gemmatimonadaceae bacterium]|nr:hypothetical protein [Gemmatimonadaceae bacterium]
PMHPRDHEPPSRTVAGGASAMLLATQVDPGVNHRTLREGYLTQPMLHGHASLLRGLVAMQGMVNFEGATLARGELAPGAYGEGYADRRHPHTWLHEAVLTLSTPERLGAAASLSGGKGFAPFGTDDPMVRPIARFPVNHHLSQILERGVIVGAARWRPLAFEYGIFNGDEPESPTDAPNASHFGDSWAARVTLRPLDGFELQGSTARVESPEAPSGHGFDHHKRSASLRGLRSTPVGDVYLLAEWATTNLFNRGRKAFHLSTSLVEASLDRGALRAALRFERTLRPEEERLQNPFRTPYPTAEVQILGTTRFDVATASVGGTWRVRGVTLAPFVEGSLVRAHASVLPAVFVPEQFYGAPRIIALSLGVRMAVGAPHHRVGRYGVAAEAPAH